ncbi:MAG: hypothetical protein ACOX4I_00800 [Anaerovoracaceae bacterium]|jgi:hypothetical protein
MISELKSTDEPVLQTGICRFCGQSTLVKAYDEEGANERATYECHCTDAARYRREKDAFTALDDALSEPEKESGFAPLSDEQKEVVRFLANHIINNDLFSAQLDIGGRTVKIKRKDEAFSFLQTRKIEQEVDC